ncbi:hypothetical protein Nepgr_007988 [Nepenthes gracilis]|uniref:Uncharacterized protein n=1 Tax=Nepenthes gracilis TaxID=150966 RepID=A0AAD3XIT9_NEPGR|nr:hypothetical protein Nepgr_007988 [Nepenthes gracilis]
MLHQFQFQPPATAQQRAAKGHQLKNHGEHAHHQVELHQLPEHLNSVTGPLPINTAIDIHPVSTPTLGASATPSSCSSCRIKLRPRLHPHRQFHQKALPVIANCKATSGRATIIATKGHHPYICAIRSHLAQQHTNHPYSNWTAGKYSTGSNSESTVLSYSLKTQLKRNVERFTATKKTCINKKLWHIDMQNIHQHEQHHTKTGQRGNFWLPQQPTHKLHLLPKP